ncbi:MAG: hypothetical protein U0263_03695 [Polyangiaceae bacterium]
MRKTPPRWLAALVGLAVAVGLGGEASAKGKAGRDPRLALITPNGRPNIRIDRVEFAGSIQPTPGLKKYLKKRLVKESRRAKWGAGRNNTVQYRFTVTELSLTEDGDVLKVRCTAVGRLPGGQAAKSHLAFSGDPKKRRQMVEHVLDIVARGVVTRLAELERIRRGNLTRSGVRPPRAVD